MRHIRLLQGSDLLRGKLQRKGGHGIVEVVWFARADDRCSYDWLGEDPRERDLRAGNAPLCRDLRDALDDLAVCILCSRVEDLADFISLHPVAARIPVTGQAP